MKEGKEEKDDEYVDGDVQHTSWSLTFATPDAAVPRPLGHKHHHNTLSVVSVTLVSSN